MDLKSAEQELQRRRDAALDAFVKMLLEVSGPDRIQNLSAYQNTRDRLERLDHGLALLSGIGRAAP